MNQMTNAGTDTATPVTETGPARLKHPKTSIKGQTSFSKICYTQPDTFRKSCSKLIGWRSTELRALHFFHKQYTVARTRNRKDAYLYMVKAFYVWKARHPHESSRSRSKMVDAFEYFMWLDGRQSYGIDVQDLMGITTTKLEADLEKAIDQRDSTNPMMNHIQQVENRKRVQGAVVTTKNMLSTSMNVASMASDAASVVEASAIVGGITAPITVATTTVKSALAVRSYWKTRRHIRGLQRVVFDEYCGCKKRIASASFDNMFGDARESHANLVEEVLPYIIEQKKKKRGRQKANIVPLVGTIGVTAIKTAHGAAKRWDGKKGVLRRVMTRDLVDHFYGYDCPVADAIVAELCGEAQMKELKDSSYAVVWNVLAEKMRSI